MSSGSVEDIIVLGGQLQATRANEILRPNLSVGDNVCVLALTTKWSEAASVIAIQFSLGVVLFTFLGSGPLPLPPIDHPVFQACLFTPSPRIGNGPLAPIVLELMYDVSVVGLIMAKSWKDRSLNGMMGRGGILRSIVKDGVIYFLVIFSTMFTLLCMSLFAPGLLKLINAHLVAIMINRLTINLHRSVKSKAQTSLTPRAVPHSAGPFIPTWMINTQDYSSSGDIDTTATSDMGDLAPSHESQGIELEVFSSSRR
ncbi:hypothetical protein JB92DRAFT_2835992 [Gautieria morchelliformis]|nr:hypothetical protein JB92DRAFT_2835992 [Gautieria morchelliformis]